LVATLSATLIGAVVAYGASQAHAQAVDSGANIKADGTTIRLLINASGSQSFPAFVMKRFGLDKKYGFELQTIPTSTTQASVVAMQSGGAEIGAWNWPDIGRMATAGTKVIGIGPVMKWANTVVSPADSTIRSFTDLKGKRLGVIQRTGLDWIIMRAVAKSKYNFDIEKEVTMQEGAVNLLRGLIEQRQLDASIMYNDFTPGMLATGQFRQILRIKDLVAELGLQDSPYILFGARLDYATASAQNIRAFMAAHRDAVQILATNDEVWVEAAKTLKIVDSDIVKRFREQTRPLFASTFSPDAEDDIRKTFGVLLETAGPGLLGMTRLPDRFMTLDFQKVGG
jgi:ABC-type nitrate/sulfonate/bicarbonate transport system substrate-binding protein